MKALVISTFEAGWGDMVGRISSRSFEGLFPFFQQSLEHKVARDDAVGDYQPLISVGGCYVALDIDDSLRLLDRERFVWTALASIGGNLFNVAGSEPFCHRDLHTPVEGSHHREVPHERLPQVPRGKKFRGWRCRLGWCLPPLLQSGLEYDIPSDDAIGDYQSSIGIGRRRVEIDIDDSLPILKRERLQDG